MKLLILTLFALSCFAQDAPQVLLNPFDVPKLRALGLPGIPPDAKSHIQAIVRFVDPGIGAVVVILKGKDAAGVEFSLQSLPALVNQWGAFAIFPFENPYAVSVTEIRLVPMRADETISLKRGATGLWTAQEPQGSISGPKVWDMRITQPRRGGWVTAPCTPETCEGWTPQEPQAGQIKLYRGPETVEKRMCTDMGAWFPCDGSWWAPKP